MPLAPESRALLADTGRLKLFLASQVWRSQYPAIAGEPTSPIHVQHFSCLRLSLVVIDGTVVGPEELPNVESLFLNNPLLAARRLGYLSGPSDYLVAPVSTPVSSVTWPLDAIRVRDLEVTHARRERTASVGVIDSGVTDSHASLAGAVSLARVMAFRERGGEVTSEVPRRLLDNNGHGTAVCGVIAGRRVDNYRGVAPDSLITFAALCGSTVHDVQLVAALDWLCSQGSRIINISFGFGGARPAHELLLARVREKSVPICAVGNIGMTSPGSTRQALSVGAAYESGLTWEDSAQNVGPLGLVAPDLLAPGVAVSVPVTGTADSYRVTSATSYAAPHIAGLFAALYERCPCEPTVDQIERAVRESAGPRQTPDSPLGIPDAVAAMKRLEELCQE